MKELGCAESRRDRRLLVAIPLFPPPTAPRTPDFYLQPIPTGLWENDITLRSTRAARMYEPGNWISRVSPTPLLLIVARDDKLTVADLALAAYEGALEPKRLALIPGGHFDPYLDQFPLAEAAATQWFREHLLNHGASHP
jgi:fermentation-respiration switch protein FrsA (DUF1100 family)